jgi:hypothetical protein
LDTKTTEIFTNRRVDNYGNIPEVKLEIGKRINHGEGLGDLMAKRSGWHGESRRHAVAARSRRSVRSQMVAVGNLVLDSGYGAQQAVDDFAAVIDNHGANPRKWAKPDRR